MAALGSRAAIRTLTGTFPVLHPKADVEDARVPRQRCHEQRYLRASGIRLTAPAAPGDRLRSHPQPRPAAPPAQGARARRCPADAGQAVRRAPRAVSFRDRRSGADYEEAPAEREPRLVRRVGFFAESSSAFTLILRVLQLSGRLLAHPRGVELGPWPCAVPSSNIPGPRCEM